MAEPTSLSQFPMSDSADPLADERRDSLRVDDQLLLDYRLEGEPDHVGVSQREPISDEAIATFFAKPAGDVVAHPHRADADGQLVQWLMKIDWALEVILKTLARMTPNGLSLPMLSSVNISGGGLRFTAEREFKQSDIIEVSLVLPPFTPVNAKAEVLRVTPQGRDGARYHIAARFVTISPDDRERLIRHILLLQAERLRSRHIESPGN